MPFLFFAKSRVVLSYTFFENGFGRFFAVLKAMTQLLYNAVFFKSANLDKQDI